jgi:hypothetical protein
MSATAWKRRRDLIQENLNSYLQELAAMDALGDIGEGAGSMYLSTYRKQIEVLPLEDVSARDVALAVLSALKRAGNSPAKATKSFDATTGKVTFEIPGPMPGWTVRVSGGEPRCKIKKVVRTVEVPVTETVTVGMTTKEVVTFEIENPEECGAEVSG